MAGDYQAVRGRSIMPAETLAKQHRKVAEPGTGRSANTPEHLPDSEGLNLFRWRYFMARKFKKRRYSRSSGSEVEGEMRRYKKGTARSGRGGKGGKVKSRKQAIAIGLSKARKKGKKVPKKKS